MVGGAALSCMHVLCGKNVLVWAGLDLVSKQQLW